MTEIRGGFLLTDQWNRIPIMDENDPWGKYPAMMTVEQVAEALQVAPKTLFMWRKGGTGPPYTQLSDTPSSSVRYPREELRRYLADRTTRSSVPVVSA